jgi:hypothetical protein
MKPVDSLAVGPAPVSDTEARRQGQYYGDAFVSSSRFISEAMLRIFGSFGHSF